MLRLFVNTLTADDKYYRINVQNLLQQFQTPLSQKQKTFPRFSLAFLICAGNLENFQKKDKYLSRIISENKDPENRGYINI